MCKNMQKHRWTCKNATVQGLKFDLLSEGQISKSSQGTGFSSKRFVLWKPATWRMIAKLAVMQPSKKSPNWVCYWCIWNFRSICGDLKELNHSVHFTHFHYIPQSNSMITRSANQPLEIRKQNRSTWPQALPAAQQWHWRWWWAALEVAKAAECPPRPYLGHWNQKKLNNSTFWQSFCKFMILDRYISSLVYTIIWMYLFLRGEISCNLIF